MSLVYNKSTPDWVKEEKSSLSKNESQEQDIRPLRIGIINYMPDKALTATEQDFLQPIIEASGSHQVEPIFFSPSSIERSEETQQYIIQHYTKVTRENLTQCDLLIHTGANDLQADGTGIDFTNSEVAKEMIYNYKLAKDAGVTTQVASCLASQVIGHNIYNIPISSRITREKVTGVFPHKVTKAGKLNFLTKELNDKFNVVYSRNHSLNSQYIEDNNRLTPLIQSISEETGGIVETHLFGDLKELFFGFQGHPEYQKDAILKEFLRDVGIHYKDPENIPFPTTPPNYFTESGLKKTEIFKKEISIAIKAQKAGFNVDRPQVDISIEDDIKQSWRDTADKIWARIFNATYQLTGFEPGQKLTHKRDIAIQEFPLEALI